MRESKARLVFDAAKDVIKDSDKLATLGNSVVTANATGNLGQTMSTVGALMVEIIKDKDFLSTLFFDEPLADYLIQQVAATLVEFGVDAIPGPGWLHAAIEIGDRAIGMLNVGFGAWRLIDGIHGTAGVGDFSPVSPSEKYVIAHTEWAPANASEVVRIGGAYEAATHDSRGHIWFWRWQRSDMRWSQIGTSTYPSYGNGTRLVMHAIVPPRADHALYVATGAITGDGSGSAVVYMYGPAHGWGAAKVRSATMTSTGAGPTEASMAGVHFDASLLSKTTGGPILLTEDINPLFSIAGGDQYPLVRYWGWKNDRLVESRTNAFRATPVGAPPKALPPWPQRKCATDGALHAQMITMPLRGGDTDARVPIKVLPRAWSNHAPAMCAFELSPDFPIAISTRTSTGATHWVTAPAWLLVADSVRGDLVTLPPAEVAGDYSRYLLLKSMGTIVRSNLNTINPGSDWPTNVADVDITVKEGQVTSLALLPPAPLQFQGE